MVQRHVSHPSRSLRLVVETDDPALVISDFVCFKDAGFDVVVCQGPDPEHPCPAEAGAPCSEVAKADVVFNAFREPRMQHDVAESVHRTTGTPMVVSLAPGMIAELPGDCILLTDKMSVSAQTDAVRRAAFGSARRSAR